MEWWEARSQMLPSFAVDVVHLELRLECKENCMRVGESMVQDSKQDYVLENSYAFEGSGKRITAIIAKVC